MIDVAVIGCGIVGASLAYELSKYELNCVVLEKENDIADATTKANSAIVHAGYDPEPGTLMARLNVEGAKMIEELCEKLSVSYKKCGSLVLAFDEKDMQSIGALLEKGVKNQVPEICILSKEETLKMEPNLSSSIMGSLYAPSGAIVNPWELCIALADTAKINGIDFCLNTPVTAIEKKHGYYIIDADGKKIEAKFVVNAAGVHSGDVCAMVEKPDFTIIPNSGQYFLMDKEMGNIVKRVVFQCPSKLGKGVLVAPTVHGNLIVGPDSVDIEDGDNVSTTSKGMEFVKQTAKRSVPGIDYSLSIRNFAGVRAQSNRDDFIIEQCKTAKGFFNLAGIKSPGLSSAPAIALECLKMLSEAGLALNKKSEFTDERHVIKFKELDSVQKSELIRDNPLFGRVICRCETITEGEIVEALHSPITPRTIDAIKKRCNAGMGRCQGGFCGPRVHEIISRELKIPMEEVLLNKEGTIIITGETKGGARL